MKAYTNVEQSRKLAEVLPIESADMKFPYLGGEQYGTTALFGEPIEFSTGKDISVWSLAALLSVIPQEIFDGEYIINITEGCNNRWLLTYDHCENEHQSYYGLSSGADNLVDACVIMIEKLYKCKML